MNIGVVQVPVSDVDRAKGFCSKQLGFDVDVDRVVPGGMRTVQLTPPGSGCSMTFFSDPDGNYRIIQERPAAG